MRLLEKFTHNQQEWRLSELARALELPRSTGFRLVHTLEKLKYLERPPQRKTFQLGNRVLNLGFEYLASQEMLEVVRPFLTILNEQTRCSVHLGVLDNREVVYLLRIAGRQHLASNVGVGTRFPAHATTMGRVLLSECSLQELQKLYEGIELRKITEQTAISVQELHQLLGEERKRGYSLSLSAFEAGVVSVGTGIRDASGKIIAAINITGSETVFGREVLEGEIKDRVLEAAGAISKRLGYRV